MTVQKNVRLGSLEVFDDPSATRLYQKILQPSLCAVSVQTHPNRHGVDIHSSVAQWKKPSSSYINNIKKQRLRAEVRTKQSRSFPDINNSRSTAEFLSHSYQHIHNEVNIHRSTTPQSFSSTTRLKQVPFPSVQGIVHERVLSPRNTRSFTFAGERYLGSARSRPQQQRSLSAGRQPRSEQEKRFVKEQIELDRTRSMKRMSETMSHRVDRLYYMRGAVIKPEHRYSVDNDELVRLKEMSKARASGRSSQASQVSDIQLDYPRLQDYLDDEISHNTSLDNIFVNEVDNLKKKENDLEQTELEEILSNDSTTEQDVSVLSDSEDSRSTSILSLPEDVEVANEKKVECLNDK